MEMKLRRSVTVIFFCNDTPTTEIYPYVHTLSLHDALPISGTEDRVGARREYLDPFGATGDLEPEGQPTAPPDPVLLHQLDLVGPVIERLQPLEQFIGELGDPEIGRASCRERVCQYV